MKTADFLYSTYIICRSNKVTQSTDFRNSKSVATLPSAGNVSQTNRQPQERRTGCGGSPPQAVSSAKLPV